MGDVDGDCVGAFVGGLDGDRVGALDGDWVGFFVGMADTDGAGVDIVGSLGGSFAALAFNVGGLVNVFCTSA